MIPKSINTSAIPPAEYCAITLRQLMAVEANIIRKCRKEGWTDRNKNALSPKDVSLYDTHKYVIFPFTEAKKKSFVTCLPSTAGPQPPWFCASHWWGEPVTKLINCLEQFIKDFSDNHSDKDDRNGGWMTVDTPIWICAFGKNQHALGGYDPRDSGFTKAMRVAKGRTIAILDEEGIVFTMICFLYELFLTLIDGNKEKSTDGLWAIYTLHAMILLKVKSWMCGRRSSSHPMKPSERSSCGT